MKITAWRILQARHLPTAFSGEGARDYPGRWNKRGTPVVYTAGSLSLATVEMLVHLGSADVLNLYGCIPISFDDTLCHQLAISDLPAEWATDPALLSTRAIGDKWVTDASSAILAVPSAIIHIETVFVLNPAHPHFDRIKIGDASEFRFDPRLLKPKL